ncbi:subtilisin-like protease [Auriscalpium vulgare]|uniref:Subtilisin-like protease n=1 Tax=Auriscalpium vulgare TaxID=40419 RepID=A0ACB8S0H7_9AGAM|nr:subtilisin-like protease [Auriscalpium vulgare]
MNTHLAMKFLGVLVPLALTGFVLADLPPEDAIELPIVPGKFIVEVDSSSNIPGKRSIDAPHANILRHLSERGVGFNVSHEYNSPGLFVGAAITLDDANDAKELQQAPGVIAIRPVIVVPAPKPVESHIISGPNDANVPPDTQSTHVLTGVDKLHAEGRFGAGIKIGIIDTGVDYTHPSLGGGFGPGFKVASGYDFVGDYYEAGLTPRPDDDPLDQCNGHGTHVTGIIGADPGNIFNISGVAYKSTLAAYRIFGCTGSVGDDIIVAALLRGVADNQDILTLSLGAVSAWSTTTASVVASRIAATGVVVTVAAGNDGTTGAWYTSAPGDGADVISVASTDNTYLQLQEATVNGVDHDGIPYYQLWSLAIPGEYPIYATSTNTSIADDACDPLPDSTPNLSSYVTIVRRGTCSFPWKLQNLASKGANVVLFYDDGTGFNTTIDVGGYQNASYIRAADGAWLVSQFVANVNVTLSFPNASTPVFTPAGGLISYYSSYGPTNDMYFKPAVAAPGGNILSTYPLPLGTWAVLSGTSMATPFIAGSAALLLEAQGKAVSLSARTVFETTAQVITLDHSGSGVLETAAHQGAGLVDVYKAIHTETSVTPGELLLNDTANYKGTQSITVTNTGQNLKAYKLTHVPAGTALTIQSNSVQPAVGPVPVSTASATVQLSSTDFLLLPGQSREVTVVIKPPTNVDAKTFPVFSGYIKVQSETEDTHVTYLGVAAALKDAQVLDNSNAVFGLYLPLINGMGTMTAENFSFSGFDYPVLQYRLTFGTPLLRIDLVEPNITLKTTLNHRSDVKQRDSVLERPIFSFPHGNLANTFAQVSIVGPLFEFDYAVRHTASGYASITQGAGFANTSDWAPGYYRFLVRALKITGDLTQEEDFESWLSPIIGYIADE